MRWLILLIFTGCSFGAKAQYQSFFGETSTSWTAVGGAFNTNEWTDSAAYEKDTLIAGMSYQKISRWRAYPDNLYVHDLFFREDTTVGKLWRRFHPDSTDELIVDLSLNVGGQFINPINNTTILTVDSVYYVNSRKHVRLNTQFNLIRFEFIEGVGPNVGPLYSTGLILLCQYKDSILNYVLNIPQYPGICNVHSLTSVDELLYLGMSVYPNPTRGLVKIETRQKQKGLKVYLHDPIGRQLLESDCLAGGRCEIDLSQFSPGILLLTIRNRSNVIVRQEKVFVN